MDDTTAHAVYSLVLKLLDDIATSDSSMGFEDIDDLCSARQILAAALDLPYDEDTGRYTPTK